MNLRIVTFQEDLLENLALLAPLGKEKLLENSALKKLAGSIRLSKSSNRKIRD